MMKCIGAVLIVLGMIMTAGATPHAFRTRAPIYEPYRFSWAELREELHRRKGFRRTCAKKYLYTLWCLVPGTRVPGTTAVYVFRISRHYLFLRPATRTGIFSAVAGIVSHLR